mgnify:CR=1 FL=1
MLGDEQFAENDAYVHATPLIRRLAREFGVNLAKVKGTGRKGRILREDVQAYVKDAVKRAETAPTASATATATASAKAKAAATAAAKKAQQAAINAKIAAHSGKSS